MTNRSLKMGFRIPCLILFLTGIVYSISYAQIVQNTADTLQPKVFTYRGWSIAVDSEQLDVEELYFNTAIEKAKEYSINTLELHDFVMKGGIVDALSNYDSFPKLKNLQSYSYSGKQLSKTDKAKYGERFRSMVAKAQANNISVNVWYHVLRDLPSELVKEYPEISDVENGFIWKYLDNSLSEFFQKFPEVDRLTLISLHETPSILKNTGKLSREEVLLELYMTIYKTCKRFGKELIIRDFIVSQIDYETFWNILDKLPPEIYIMTKSVSADWSHLDIALNPNMNRYVHEKLIVEFDLYGEWSGRGDFPVCYPDDIIRHLRESKACNAMGAMGRLIHDTRPSNQLPFKTIFDSPMEINVYTFSKYISQPMPWLGETDEKWNEDIEAIDKKYWMQWAKQRYGEKAGVPIVRALERTSEINKLTFDIAGLSSRYYVWYPTFFKIHPPGSNKIADTWNVFNKQVNMVGINYLRDEKLRALKLATESLEDIQSVRGSLSKGNQLLLESLFKSMLLIIKSYQLALDGYYQVYKSLQAKNEEGKISTAKALNGLADKIDEQKGKGWYFNLTSDMRILAKDILNGKPPITLLAN